MTWEYAFVCVYICVIMMDKCSDDLRAPDHDNTGTVPANSHPLLHIYLGIMPRNPLYPTNFAPVVREGMDGTSEIAG